MINSLIAVLIYYAVGIIVMKPWQSNGGLFCFSIPLWLHFIFITFWFPWILFQIPGKIEETGFIGSVIEVVRKTLLHIWIPVILLYILKDKIDDGEFKKFQKEYIFKSRLAYNLFKKVQSVKEELGYIYWSISDEEIIDNGYINVCCEMQQRLN